MPSLGRNWRGALLVVFANTFITEITLHPPQADIRAKAHSALLGEEAIRYRLIRRSTGAAPGRLPAGFVCFDARPELRLQKLLPSAGFVCFDARPELRLQKLHPSAGFVCFDARPELRLREASRRFRLFRRATGAASSGDFPPV